MVYDIVRLDLTDCSAEVGELDFESIEFFLVFLRVPFCFFLPLMISDVFVSKMLLIVNFTRALTVRLDKAIRVCKHCG